MPLLELFTSTIRLVPVAPVYPDIVPSMYHVGSVLSVIRTPLAAVNVAVGPDTTFIILVPSVRSRRELLLRPIGSRILTLQLLPEFVSLDTSACIHQSQTNWLYGANPVAVLTFSTFTLKTFPIKEITVPFIYVPIVMLGVVILTLVFDVNADILPSFTIKNSLIPVSNLKAVVLTSSFVISPTPICTYSVITVKLPPVYPTTVPSIYHDG